MPDPRDYLPAARLETLRLRAALLSGTRRFFDDLGYFEVETPLLSHDIVVDAHLEPFTVSDPGGGPELFLQTSPEFGMKRLLAAGADAIYQITRSFRRAERGRLHNPEFTIVEWYRVGDTHHEQMGVVEQLVRHVLSVPTPSGRSDTGRTLDSGTPFLRSTWDEAFRRVFDRGVLRLSASELVALATAHDIGIPDSLDRSDRDELLNLLLAERVEPTLGVEYPELLYDYPDSQSALARVRDDDPPVAERFELYINGIELCNGYHELTDADELRRRVVEQNAIRQRNGSRRLPESNRLLAAMDAGLPACSGVALGFDRLVMLSLGLDSVDDVIGFPADRC